MKKKRARNEPKISHTPIQQAKKDMESMRGLVQAARAPYARRLITPAKAMSQINELTRKVSYEFNKIHDHRRQSVPVVDSQISRRHAPDQRQLSRQALPAQVRKLHYDARRALVCQSRADRREVLFALQKVGKNGHRNRKAVWSPLSFISCKTRG